MWLLYRLGVARSVLKHVEVIVRGETLTFAGPFTIVYLVDIDSPHYYLFPHSNQCHNKVNTERLFPIAACTFLLRKIFACRVTALSQSLNHRGSLRKSLSTLVPDYSASVFGRRLWFYNTPRTLFFYRACSMSSKSEELWALEYFKLDEQLITR